MRISPSQLAGEPRETSPSPARGGGSGWGFAAAATIAGIVSGLVAGVLGRIAMRIVAVSRGDVPSFSITATIGILIVFLVMGCALALVFAIVARGNPARPEPGWWSLAGVGLLAGVVLLTPLRSEVAGRPAFLVLFLPVGLLLGWGSAWLALVIARSLPNPSGAARYLYGLVAAPAVLATLAVPVLLVFGILQSIGVIPIPDQ